MHAIAGASSLPWAGAASAQLTTGEPAAASPASDDLAVRDSPPRVQLRVDVEGSAPLSLALKFGALNLASEYAIDGYSDARPGHKWTKPTVLQHWCSTPCDLDLAPGHYGVFARPAIDDGMTGVIGKGVNFKLSASPWQRLTLRYQDNLGVRRTGTTIVYLGALTVLAGAVVGAALPPKENGVRIPVAEGAFGVGLAAVIGGVILATTKSDTVTATLRDLPAPPRRAIGRPRTRGDRGPIVAEPRCAIWTRMRARHRNTGG